MELTKTIFEIGFYSVGIVGGIMAIIGGWLAVRTYRENQSLERSRWASSLYEKFYEKTEHKGVRRVLDCSSDSQEVAELVGRESPEFTDYLNFFEHVAYLVKCEQIKREDAEAYFNYYFSCLKRHAAVMQYVQNESNGYEMLKEFLAS